MAVNQNAEKLSVRKFNIIDVFLIILVVLCILGVYFRAQVAEWIGIEKKVEEYKISFEVSGMRYTSGKYLPAGSEIYFEGGNVLIGTIDGNCITLPASTFVNGPDGAPVKVSYPKETYIDLSGTIKCMGIMKDEGFYLSGTYALSPGSTINDVTISIRYGSGVYRRTPSITIKPDSKSENDLYILDEWLEAEEVSIVPEVFKRQIADA